AGPRVPARGQPRLERLSAPDRARARLLRPAGPVRSGALSASRCPFHAAGVSRSAAAAALIVVAVAPGAPALAVLLVLVLGGRRRSPRTPRHWLPAAAGSRWGSPGPRCWGTRPGATRARPGPADPAPDRPAPTAWQRPEPAGGAAPGRPGCGRCLRPARRQRGGAAASPAAAPSAAGAGRPPGR